MIDKKAVISILKNNGDSIIEFYNSDEPICCTTDFSNKYIRRVRRSVRFSLKGNVLIFDWTSYKFDAIAVKSIKVITPLQKILGN